MCVYSKVDIVFAEEFECCAILWHKIIYCLFPRLVGVVVAHIPVVLANAEKRYLRCLGILHRVGCESRQHIGNVEVVTPRGTHQQVVDAVIGYGVVEPYKCLAAYLVVNPLHIGLVNHIYHAVACPHYAYLFVHCAAQCVQIVAA